MKEVNPLKSLRVAGHFTMDQIAEFADVSRQYVVRAEQAVFSTLPVKVADAVLTLTDSDLDLQELGFQYEGWQRLRRDESFGSLTPGFDFHEHGLNEHGLNEHPFIHWREHSGLPARISVSKLFCIHPALMFKFEVQPWLVLTVPSELLVALKQSGYHPEDLKNLEAAYLSYRKARRS